MITWLAPYLPRHAIGRAPASAAPTLADDLTTLHAAGITHIVCLQEPHELSRLEPPETLATRRAAIEARGMRMLHAPIEDFAAPALPDARALVTQLSNVHADPNTQIFLHCQAGLGRAGTIAACLLVARGVAPGEAITLVRWMRPGAIQSAAQEALIYRFGTPDL